MKTFKILRKYFHIGFVFGVVWLGCVPSWAEVRTWTDATGQHEVEAEFVAFDGEQVTLRKRDGSRVQIPMLSLSVADQERIRRIEANARKSTDAGEEEEERGKDDPLDSANPLTDTHRWVDRNTQRTLDATFVEMQDDGVLVRRPDGRRALIPFDRLSDQDREYVWKAVWMLGNSRTGKSPTEPADHDSGGSTDENPKPDSSSSNTAEENAPHADELETGGPFNFNQSVKDLASAWEELVATIPSSAVRRWLEFPQVYWVLGCWVGLAFLTGFQAAMHGRSPLLWLLIGTACPGCTLFIMPFLGSRANIDLEAGSFRFRLLQAGVIVTGLAGLLGIIAVATSDVPVPSLEISREFVSNPHVVTTALFGINVVLTLTLAATIRRSVTRWGLAAVVLPFLAPALLSYFATRHLVFTDVVVVCGVDRLPSEGNIAGLRYSGAFHPYSRVVKQKIRRRSPQESLDSQAILDQVHKAAEGEFPEQKDQRQRFVKLSGREFSDGSEAIWICPAMPAQPPTKAQLAGLQRVRFVKQYVETQRVGSKNVAYTHEVYWSDDPKAARAFLERRAVRKPMYYVHAESPSGRWSFGKDADGIYTEQEAQRQAQAIRLLAQTAKPR